MSDGRFWRNKKVLITAGPTQEPLDPVRFISNTSSGQMGYALARAARRLGAHVTLVSGPVALKPPAGVRVIPVTTALDMLRASLRYGLKSDLVIGAAAVADWRPARSANRKLKKKKYGSMTLRFLPNPDILKTVARRRRGPYPRLAGFALETDDLLKNAQKKLVEKSLDLIVANPHTVLRKSSTRALLLTRSGKKSAFRSGTKQILARRIFSVLAQEPVWGTP